MSTPSTFQEKIVALQAGVKVGKEQYNAFGKYAYWTVGDILAEVKPLANKLGLYVLVRDEVVEISGRFYIKATASVSDGTSSIESTAMAREEESKAGMSAAQITGSSSSYARKYCLAALFGLDGEKDADATNDHSTKPVHQNNSQQNQQPAPENRQLSRPENSSYQASKPLTGEASKKQVDYIKSLAFQKGVDAAPVKTAQDASDEIKRLSGLPSIK